MSEQWTDERIEEFRDDLAFIYEGEYDPQPRRETFAAWLAAVIARAKRDERERISARTIYVVQKWVEADGIHDGWNTAYGSFTNSRADAEGRLEYLQKTHRDAEFRLVTATRSDWQETDHA